MVFIYKHTAKQDSYRRESIVIPRQRELRLGLVDISAARTNFSTMSRESVNTLLPPRPDEPQETDCCGSGCNPCVFDIYQKQLTKWEKQCDDIINNPGHQLEIGDGEQSELLLSQIKFTPFQLLSIEQHTHNTFLYLFQSVNRDADYMQVRRPLGINVGQHLVLRCSSGTVLTRAYTPISDKRSSDVGQFKMLIKLYEDGRMSRYLRSLKQDDIVEWRGPCGDFKYVPNSYTHLLMICAGTGVAPMYPIAKSIVEDDCEDTFVHLIFACRGFEDILLRSEIQQLSSYWNFSAEIFLSRAEEAAQLARYGEHVIRGRLDKVVIERELAGKRLEKVLVLVCGTKSFNKDMVNYMRQVGMPDDNVHLF